MASLDLTCGIELEFIAIYPEDNFPNPSGETTMGRTLYAALIDANIPATGWEPIDFDIDDDHPTHSRWRVETDVLSLSAEEQYQLPSGWTSEAVELSSRKFSLARDDWEAEIREVLNVLRRLESSGCRFMTNQSTGLHVHVGNGTQNVPLPIARRVFQLVTAFERCFDELHTVPRVALPDPGTWPHWYYPPSFFHSFVREEGTVVPEVFRFVPMFDRLVDIEAVGTYEELAALFRFGSDWPPAITGHNTAYNFDNLFAEERLDRFERTLTKTIEFRQHTGTLDFLEIVKWVRLACQIVEKCSTIADDHFMDFCFCAADTDFDLSRLLLALGCSGDVIQHFLGDGPIGHVGPDTNAGFVRIPEVDAVLEQNDHECEKRADRDAVRTAIVEKLQSGLYGLNPTVHTMPFREAAMFDMERIRHMSGERTLEPGSEGGLSQVRMRVFRHFSMLCENLMSI